jgi:hypothetical protein
MYNMDAKRKRDAAVPNTKPASKSKTQATAINKDALMGLSAAAYYRPQIKNVVEKRRAVRMSHTPQHTTVP